MLCKEGWTLRTIAGALFCSRTIVYRAVSEYQQSELDPGLEEEATSVAARVVQANLKWSLLALLKRSPEALGQCRVR
ncbi:MAG: helix-turn-helix domain-containing protein [Acidobacteria bacterium]|nr:helix-turn-helix domain-containing protein [Acidobacteriota bacterium]MCW5969461.1 helix-turn-helix domain-containing protein [Blastocatellales bacterium]